MVKRIVVLTMLLASVSFGGHWESFAFVADIMEDHAGSGAGNHTTGEFHAGAVYICDPGQSGWAYTLVETWTGYEWIPDNGEDLSPSPCYFGWRCRFNDATIATGGKAGGNGFGHGMGYCHVEGYSDSWEQYVISTAEGEFNNTARTSSSDVSYITSSGYWENLWPYVIESPPPSNNGVGFYSSLSGTFQSDDWELEVVPPGLHTIVYTPIYSFAFVECEAIVDVGTPNIGSSTDGYMNMEVEVGIGIP